MTDKDKLEISQSGIRSVNSGEKFPSSSFRESAGGTVLVSTTDQPPLLTASEARAQIKKALGAETRYLQQFADEHVNTAEYDFSLFFDTTQLELDGDGDIVSPDHFKWKDGNNLGSGTNEPLMYRPKKQHDAGGPDTPLPGALIMLHGGNILLFKVDTEYTGGPKPLSLEHSDGRGFQMTPEGVDSAVAAATEILRNSEPNLKKKLEAHEVSNSDTSSDPDAPTVG